MLAKIAFCLLAALAWSAGSDSPTPAAGGPATILTGRVLTPGGTPVADAFVTIHGGLATRWRVGDARTDAEGWFRFDPLPGGARVKNSQTDEWDYYVGVHIEHPDFASAVKDAWWDVRCPLWVETREEFRLKPLRE